VPGGEVARNHAPEFGKNTGGLGEPALGVEGLTFLQLALDLGGIHGEDSKHAGNRGKSLRQKRTDEV